MLPFFAKKPPSSSAVGRFKSISSFSEEEEDPTENDFNHACRNASRSVSYFSSRDQFAGELLCLLFVESFHCPDPCPLLPPDELACAVRHSARPVVQLRGPVPRMPLSRFPCWLRHPSADPHPVWDVSVCPPNRYGFHQCDKERQGVKDCRVPRVVCPFHGLAVRVIAELNLALAYAVNRKRASSFAIPQRPLHALLSEDASPYVRYAAATAFEVLNLGNVEFTNDLDGKAVAKDREQIAKAAGLLGVPTDSLVEVLTSKTIKTSVRRFTADAAGERRDALAKSIYDQLFNFLVLECNLAIEEVSHKSTQDYCVGILDFYGFENTEAVKPYFVSFMLSTASSSSSTTTTASAGPNVSSRVNANARGAPRSAAPPTMVTG